MLGWLRRLVDVTRAQEHEPDLTPTAEERRRRAALEALRERVRASSERADRAVTTAFRVAEREITERH